jgi:type I restriction enzyme R subunit
MSERYTETTLQNGIMDYIKSNLGYTEIATNQLNQDLLIIPSSLKEYLLKTQKKEFKTVCQKDYKNNERECMDALIHAISEFVYKEFNIAIQMNSKLSKFQFHNVVFELFSAYENEEDDKNIYNVIRECTIRYKSIYGKHDEYQTRRPDIVTFVNGIYFAPLEIKSNGVLIGSQTAKKDGRGQIARNVIDAISYAYLPDEDDNSFKELKAYNSPVFHLTMDEKDGYVLRGLHEKFNSLVKDVKEDKDTNAMDEILNIFYQDGIARRESIPMLDGITPSDFRKRFLFTYLSKESVQKEILYFNTLEKENGAWKLIAPRPIQLYGINKIIRKIEEEILYENSDPDREMRLLKNRLEKINLPEEEIKKFLNIRKQFKNNQDMYSMLLQYAAGSGKTNIMCWLSMLFKDMNDIHKTLLISDRIDLRNQVKNSMNKMNIDKNLTKEVTTKDELENYLSDNTTRIIIVNIHKFPGINKKDVMENILKKYSNKRFAFMIDEVHRSNGDDGQLHTSMIDLFNALSIHSGKKNIFIGFTATPTDEINMRFGEAVINPNNKDGLRWEPTDSYTMKEAVKDRFILDVTKCIVYWETSMEFIENENVRFNKALIYENEDRIKYNIQNLIVPKLFSPQGTFSKIRGKGKAMLATYSVKAAQLSYKYLAKEMDDYCRETMSPEKYEADKKNNKLPRPYIVYTSEQKEEDAYKLCGTQSEEDTIKKFKECKNGIMIVVCKLQTGFDVKELHTIFIDKELKDISAIQTLCRVNRVCKHKVDCLVVDMSFNSVNRENFKKAFKKYEDITIADSPGVEQVNNEIARYYSYIKSNEMYKQYKNSLKDLHDAQEITDAKIVFVANYVKNNVNGEFKAKTLMEAIVNFNRLVSKFKNIFTIPKEYCDDKFSIFIRSLGETIYHQLKINDEDALEDMQVVFVDAGRIDDSELQPLNTGVERNGHGYSFSNNKQTGFSILEKIALLNNNALNRLELIESYRNKFYQCCEKLFEIIETDNDKKIINDALRGGGSINSEEILQVFNKSIIKTRMKLGQNTELKTFFINFMVDDNDLINDYIRFFKEKKI